MEIKNSIECWIYHYKMKKFLMLSIEEENTLFWKPVSGDVVGDETPLVATKRAVQKEIQLKVNVTKTFYLCKQQLKKESAPVINKNVYVSLTDIQSVSISKSYLESKWLTADEVKALPFYKKNQENFEKVQAYLKSLKLMSFDRN
ncbi:hypothetical protein ACWOFR_04855 [Carnobacterium gallinarum]|uniref:hypothetical protein n=1 Tax=Carnobacterium gallinarum TaxID=2749 RepID=UPI000554CFCB|nr:hypothetical protein [Carnobacterium gallinarum]